MGKHPVAVWTAKEGTDAARGRFSALAGTIGSCLHVSAGVAWGDAVLAAFCRDGKRPREGGSSCRVCQRGMASLVAQTVSLAS